MRPSARSRWATRTAACAIGASALFLATTPAALAAAAATSTTATSTLNNRAYLEPVDIIDVAPTSTSLLLRVENWTRSREAYNRSYAGRMLNDPRFSNWYKEVLDATFGEESDVIGSFAEITDWLKELEIDLEEIGQPSGAVGIAMYPIEINQENEADKPSAGIVLLADFGPNADKLAAAIAEATEDLDERERIEADEEEYRGITIHSITIISEEEDDIEEDDDDDFMMWMNEEPSAPFGLDKIETFYWARLNNTFVVTSAMEAMEAAIDRANGDNIQNLANQPDLTDSLAQHRATHDAFILFRLVPEFRKAMMEGFGGPAMFLLGGFEPSEVIRTLGLSEVRTFSAAFHMENADGASETTIGVLMNARRGLFNLIDEPVTRFEPPPFVGPDTASVGMVTVRFESIWPLIESIVNTFPPDQREEAQGGLLMAQGFAKPILDNMGPDLYIINNIERPFTANSSKTLVAIRARDINPITNAINGFGAMLGLEAREFQGFQVFEPPAEMGGGPTIGLGGDFVLIGETSSVEQGLRGISDPRNPRLSAEPAFTAALNKLDNRGTSFAYTNTRQSLAWTFWQMRNADKIWEEQMRSAGIDLEENPWFASMKPEIPAWMDKLPDINAFLEYIGDYVFEFRPSPDGFRARYIVLPPTRDN